MHDDAAFAAAYDQVRLSAHARRAIVALVAACALLGGLLGIAAPADAAADGHAGPGAVDRMQTGGDHAPDAARADLPQSAAAAGTGRISGQVTFPSGSWYDGTVTVTDGSYTRYAYVDYYTGHYSVGGLPAGSYRVEFNRLSGYSYSEAEFYNDHPEYQGPGSANVVGLAAGETKSGIDATLVKGGSISGKLVDGDGNPLNCDVQAYTDDGHLVTRDGYSNYWDGSFTISGLTTGAYKVRVLAHRWTDCDGGTQVLTGNGGPTSSDPAAAAPVSVVRGVDHPLASNVVYTLGGRITGHVTLPPGAQSLDRYVVVRDIDNGRIVKTAKVSAADGTYLVKGLATGSYRVTFARVSGIALTQAEFFNNHPESAGPDSRDPVAVTKGTTHAAVDATLVKGGSISGHLVDTSGNDVAGCYVQAFTSDGSLVTRAAYTEPDGTFTVGGLTTGAYKLRVVKHRDTGCRTAQFYNGTGDLGGAGTATTISVTTGNDHALAGDLAYDLGGTITGHVDLPAGSSWINQFIVVRKVHTNRTRVARLHPNGDYTVRGLGAGSYRVTFARVSGFATVAAQFFDGHDESETVASADPIVLGSGDTAVANATLSEGGHITGTLVDQSGRYLHCYLQAFTTDGSLVTRDGLSRASASGAFDIGGLTSGDYYVRVVPSRGTGCNSGIQFVTGNGGALTKTGPGSPVSVTQGDTTTITQPLAYSRIQPLYSRAAPSISGSPVVGSRLTASTGTWSQTGVTLAYQWRSNGVPIGGATSSGYTPTGGDLGHVITVKVTASKTGFRNSSRISNAVGPVAAAPVVTPPPPPPSAGPHTFTLAKKPSFKGTAKVGGVLKAVTGQTSPAAGSVKLQWLLDGKAIKHATKSKLTLLRAYAGHKVSLRITFQGSGFVDLVATSSAEKVKAVPKHK